MKKYDQHTVVVDNELWDAVADKAKNNGLSVSAIVRALFLMWMRGRIKLELE